MRLAALFTLAAALAMGADTLDVFGHKWDVPVAGDWNTEGQGGSQVLHLAQNRGPLAGVPRRPIQFALLQSAPYKTVTVEADVKPLGRSLLIVFGYRDAAHYNYAHLSTDTGVKQPVHNGIFHVYGGERVRISPEQGPPAFAETGRWYHAKLTWDASTGIVEVQVDGKPVPALNAVDLSMGPGRVGIGSFDETADFKNVKVTGTPAEGGGAR